MGIMNTDIFYEKYISEDFETKHVPHIFEDICRQYLIRRNRAGDMEEPFDAIGKYYYDDPKNRQNGEFDIVTHDDKGYIFYEAKFRNEPVNEKAADQEIAQVERTSLHCYRYGFFSKSGFDFPAKENVTLIELARLYQ
jgi:hypothetical protein